MIPKIDIQVPELLLRTFFFPKEYGGKEKLDKDISDFRVFFDKYGEKILVQIEKYSGFNWTLNRIPVYLIPASMMIRFSFSKNDLEDGLPGVVQKIGRGITDIHIHIHELVHTNQKQTEFYSKENGFAFDKEGNRNTDILELSADIVTMYVIRNLFGADSEYEKDMWNFLNNTNERNMRKYEHLIEHIDKWDLNKNNLRYHLENDRK